MAPRFSICIPVRNGAEYFPHTLRLCVEQLYFDDYEIIVSDNRSTEDIKSIIDSFCCDKIKYYRTPKFLGMGANFDYALSKSTGEYKLIIGSDDGISRYALYVLDKIIHITGERLIMWNRTEYYWPNHFYNSNTIFLWTRHSHNLVQSIDMMKGYYLQFTGLSTPPFLYNLATMHSSLISEVEKRTGQKLHQSYLADMYQAMSSAVVAERFIRLGLNLSLNAERPGSAASRIVNSLTDEYLQSHHAEDELSVISCKDVAPGCIFSKQTNSWIQRNLILHQMLDLFPEELHECKYIKIDNKTPISEMMDEYAYRASLSGSSDEYEMAVKTCWEDVKNSGDEELIAWFRHAYITNPKGGHYFKRIRAFMDYESADTVTFTLPCDGLNVRNVYDAMLLYDSINFTKEKIDKYLSDYEYSWKRAKTVCECINNKAGNGKLGIYGAAVNGRRLYYIYKYFYPDTDIEFVYFDSNVKKHGEKVLEILDIRVLAPDRIPREGLSAIVTSIFRYDEQIYDIIHNYDDAVEIIRIFEPDEFNWLHTLSSGPTR